MPESVKALAQRVTKRLTSRFKNNMEDTRQQLIMNYIKDWMQDKDQSKYVDEALAYAISADKLAKKKKSDEAIKDKLLKSRVGADLKEKIGEILMPQFETTVLKFLKTSTVTEGEKIAIQDKITSWVADNFEIKDEVNVTSEDRFSFSNDSRTTKEITEITQYAKEYALLARARMKMDEDDESIKSSLLEKSQPGSNLQEQLKEDKMESFQNQILVFLHGLK